MNPNSSTGYRNRLIFGVGLVIGTRPTELWLLDVSQFKFENVNGKAAIVYYPKMGSNLGESKNRRGGVQAVRYQTTTVPIHNVSFFDNTLNIYQLTTEYLNMRKAAGITCTRFFLGVRSGKKVDGREFWRN